MSEPSPSTNPPEELPQPAAEPRDLRRAVWYIVIAGAVIFLLSCAAGFVFLNSRGAFNVGLLGKTNTPAAAAKSSPGAATATRPAPTALPSSTAPLTETIATLQPTESTMGSAAAQPPATGANPTARTTTAPRALTRTPTAAQRAAASPTPNLAPGVYVTGMRIEPTQIMDGQNPTFYVTFLNTASTPITYTWFIKVYEPDKRQSFGEEAKVGNVMPPGTSTLPSASNWKAPGEQPCRPFIARVFYYMAQDNAVVEFSTPAGNAYLIDFKVCQ